MRKGPDKDIPKVHCGLIHAERPPPRIDHRHSHGLEENIAAIIRDVQAFIVAIVLIDLEMPLRVANFPSPSGQPNLAPAHALSIDIDLGSEFVR